jgi:hypothetical protein
MTKPTCPQAALEVLEAGFLEGRASLLEVAAFFDRIERAHDPQAAKADFRYKALRRAVEILAAPTEGRARAVLLSLSDPSREPIASAKGLKNAVGAWCGGDP